ncbi:MAG: amino acid adenylation domain-containing protein, partial [Gemmobacter sp.]|nr:amino acid adenylation domain-containing protein [Gemmobacter sp.]
MALDTFLDRLEQSLTDSAKPAFTFLEGDGRQDISFAELGRKARALAARIQQHTQPGDRVLIVHAPGQDYVIAFIAAVFAGVVAVPAISPGSVKGLPRLELIARDAGARLILTSPALAERMTGFGGPLAGLTMLTGDAAAGVTPEWRRPGTRPEDLLFLQYTSGSTGDPKGVMVSHANILDNLRRCQAAFGLAAEDVIVSWLPPHHDFGLVGGILSALFVGAHAVHLTPLAFLTRPERWLRAISDFRATVTGAPNFAWELCASRIGEAQKAGLDLSSLRVAINGAERVRAETLAAFCAAFAVQGFDPGALTPAYGLAEATLLVTALSSRQPGMLPRSLAGKDAEAEEVLQHRGALVTNGPADELVIVGAGGQALPPGETGEIWVRNGSVAQGYWGKPRESALVFGQKVGGQGGYLRTGDLGFVEKGELFVSGRMRELITLAGRDVFPQDIEPDVEALHPAFRASGCAVVPREQDGQTQLVILQEVLGKRDLETEGLVESLRAMLLERHDIAELGALVLLRTGDLPRTTSGKIQRYRCADLLARGQLAPLWSWESQGQAVRSDFAAPRDETEAGLAALWSELLGMERVSIHDNFMELSGNSLLATQVISALHQRFEVDISLRALFENPTIAQLAQEIGRARAEQANHAAASGMEAQSMPISKGQARAFYLDQFAPGDPLYNRRRILSLDGEIRLDVLARAATELARRHEVLRYRFAIADGAPTALLMPLRPVPVVQAAAENRQEAEGRAQSLADAPFDLMAGPLFRLGLISEDEETHLLVLALHAIIADETSVDILLSELAVLYSAYAEGFAAPLAEPGMQHAGLVRWQDGWMQGTVLEGQKAFWQETLADAPQALALPTDLARPPVQTHRGARHQWFAPLSGDDLDLGAAYALMLHRLSGQSDLCIGIELPQRELEGTGSLVGPLGNFAVLRLQVQTGMTIADLRRQFDVVLKAARSHGAIPFDLVVETLQPERRLNQSPLFQVLLRLEGPEAPASVFHGLKARQVPPQVVRSEFDMTLSLRRVSGGVEAQIDYAADLFEPATIARMGEVYDRSLAQMAQPDRDVLAAPLIGDAAMAQQIGAWNATGVDFLGLAPLSQMFEAQVVRTPDADCILCEGLRLSFAELNARANRLARHLHAMGIGPDCTVGLCIERSFEMMVGLVGTLKAGAAYVPLDPALPTDRLAFMAADAGVAAVLTTEALQAHLPAVDCSIFLLDREFETLPQDDSNLPCRTSMQNLAYVIYTSGSTGQPKGVAVPHAGVANRLLWMTHAFGIVPGERVMQKTPYSFDVSVWELFWPLISGAALVMARPGGHQDVAYMAGLIRDQRITTMHFVPPMLEFFLNLADLSDASSLRQVLCSGQALPVALQDRFMALLPGVKLRNMYGPTEASVEISSWDCRSDTGLMSVPIGRPLANCRMYILDAAQNPVPVGVAGELMLAGIQLARGYVNRPDLTAQSFVPDPFGAPGARLYRSGDLARFLPDGSIEYLGRIDDQVKIRGFRIELGEIEARLRAQPGLRDALVIARDDIANDRRLVAYLVASGEARDTEGLRLALLDSLPDYMVPAHFVWLEALPVTLNGKVNRRALPLPEMSRPDKGYVPPEGETEQALALIWTQLLGLDRIGAGDSFFALGGHSLLATQAISKIRARFGVDVPLRAILFDQPTIAELAPLVDALISGQAGTVMTAIQPTDRQGELDLSFSQKRLWFLDQLEPENPFYNIPAPTRLEGPLDIVAMEAALNRIVERHDILRTRFITRDARPTQIIEPGFRLRIPMVDLSHLPHEEALAEARRMAIADAHIAFDLEAAPPLRATLLRLAPEDHVILFNMHHILSDGWSMGVLVTEFVAIYRAFSAGQPDPLPPLAIQYVDFAAWQRQWLQGQTLQDQLSFWSAQLQDAPPLLALPTDFPRPAAQSYSGATQDLVIPARIVAELYALGARHQSTLYMVLLAAFNLLLSRYSRQRDICVGTYIANRNRAEIESLIGFFVNTLVLRNDVDPEAPFEDFLRGVRHRLLDAYANQDLPFEYLVDHLNPERHLSHSPLVQVAFVLQNTPMDDLDGSGLKTSPLTVESRVSKFDLTLRLTEKNGQLEGCLEYATDLFTPQTIAQMSAQFEHLLSEIIRAPRAPLHMLRLMPEAEAAGLAGLASGPAVVTEELPRFLDAFAAQVARDGDHPAIDGLSYRDLDRRSNALARALVQRGIGRGDVVGLWLGRGAGLVTAIIAVMKAGAAWLPLDLQAPEARRAFILKDARPALIVSDLAHSPTLPEGHAALLLDAFDPAPACVLPGVEPQDTAYILYTSGTTGWPKGVVIPHLAVMNHAAHHIGLCGLTPADRVLQFAATGFDTAVEEILPSLMAGAALVSRPEEFLDAGQEFDALLDRHAITVADLPTQFWQHWAQASTGMPHSLRLVVLGGEALTARQVNDWSARPDTAGIRLLNTYGPTETTIITTAREVPHGPAKADPPLGRAISGVTLRLLDDRMESVPLGVPGEIFIGGNGLAKGYLNRPDLTAERFVADPFGPAEARLYRSGDLARMQADGTISYQGRLDDQIKLRGFRIEPAEVSAALLEAGADTAFVTLWVADTGEPRLVAYVTGAGEAELQEALRPRLPSYMLPWRILVLEQFPLTPNGKIDRRALPAPDRLAREAGPRDAQSRKLAEIWGEVLGLDPDTFMDDENFFALGGHSLLATQVVSKIRTQFAMELPLRTLFEHPTVGGLARVISAALAETTPHQAAIPRLHHGGPVELSFAQQRLWFLDRLDPDSPQYNIPAALHLVGPLNRAALAHAFTEVLARHDVLRGSIRMRGHHPVMEIAAPAAFDLPLEDLGHLVPEEARAATEAICQNEAARPFDLSQGPLLRARLLRLGALDHVLVLTIHHIVADGWSIGVLVDEITALYAATLQGRSDPLAPLAIQYPDFAIWQRDWLAGDRLQRQIHYWRNQLAEAPALLALPTDRPRPAVQSHRGGTVDFALPADLVAALRQLGHAQGATLFMVMQAAFSLLLHRYSGETDILVGTPVANRNRAELEPLIGFFANTLTLRCRIDPEARFVDLLDQCRDTALAAYAHQDVPFEHLVEVLQPDRLLSQAPLFQVMLVLQNAPLRALALDDLAIAPLPVHGISAKFDLTLALHEVEEGIEGNLEYASDLFDVATIARMLRHFRILLEAIVALPGQKLGALPLLDAAERHELLVTFNETGTAVSAEVPDMVEQIAAVAAAAPEAIALSLQDERLSYGALDARANALAHRLVAQGVGPDSVVGIAAERSFGMIVALLAVLKAGGGYLPLDPDYPAQRLAHMIADAEPVLILATPGLVGQMAGFGKPVLALDGAEEAKVPPQVRAEPQARGYLIYTSGSTGTPKGITLTRAALENLVHWQCATHRTPEAVLQFASLNFDVSFQEIFSTLCAGQRLVLIPPGMNRDLNALRDYARVQDVRRMFLPNAVLQQWLLLGPTDGAPPCEIISAGEALTTGDHREALLALLNGASLFNQYGPSETHVVTELELPAAAAAHWPDRPPIGRPIWQTCAYVLDAGKEPAPVGVWGMLHIGGLPPARGYHRQPAATAAKFLPDPFGRTPGARLYETGDIARWRPDGTLEFRGRDDDQIKIRGIRVELGEVEAALRALPGIADVCVMLRQDHPGLRQLVAYVVSEAEQTIDGAALRRDLSATLPEYMVPSAFIQLPRLPLTSNGKVDRVGLPFVEGLVDGVEVLSGVSAVVAG